MNRLLLVTFLAVLLGGCFAYDQVKPEPAKPFHPTDDVSTQAQGGKGHESDGSEVNLEQGSPEPVSEAVKPFHPTDDISSQAQGGKGHESDGSAVNLEQ